MIDRSIQDGNMRGGRYDHLCQKFGKNIPSTGVAIGIERLLKALNLENLAGKEE